MNSAISKNDETAKYKVPGLEKGLEIMEYLSKYPAGRTLHEIQERLEIAQTTTYRILSTLIRLEYVGFDESSKRYILSRKLLMLGYRTLSEHSLLEAVLPRLRELRDMVHETTCFGVLGDAKGILIEQVQGDSTFCYIMSPGSSFALHCSAPGKAILAYLPKVERERVVAKMPFTYHNERTITSASEFERSLREVLKSGYAIDDEEELGGVMCIGAPILNHIGYPCGAIWTSGPKDRIMKNGIDSYIKAVMTIATQTSKDMGYNTTNK